MFKTTVVIALALLTLAGVCVAQPPGIAREVIERALLLEGAPIAVPGPCKTTIASHGVVVMGTVPQEGAARRRAAADDLGADPRVRTIDVFNSRVQKPVPGAPTSPQPTPDALPKLHGPAFYGARHNAGHTATVFHSGGGEFANVASNWLLCTFKNDEIGKNGRLCTNSNWDVRSKGIKW